MFPLSKNLIEKKPAMDNKKKKENMGRNVNWKKECTKEKREELDLNFEYKLNQKKTKQKKVNKKVFTN